MTSFNALSECGYHCGGDITGPLEGLHTGLKIDRLVSGSISCLILMNLCLYEALSAPVAALVG
jgi:hypothetical protein